MDKPATPKSRLCCDICGDISETGLHTSWGCRFFQWLDKKSKEKKPGDSMKNLVDAIISGDEEKTQDIFRKVVNEKYQEILNKNNPFWY